MDLAGFKLVDNVEKIDLAPFRFFPDFFKIDHFFVEKKVFFRIFLKI